MQLEINLDKAAIEQQVVTSIIESAIGAQIEGAIKKAMESRPGGYGDPRNIVDFAVQNVVQQKIREIAIQIINSKAEDIKKIVAEKMTDEVIKGFCDKAWESFK